MRVLKRLSNLIIVALITLVAVVGFYPQTVIPINAGANGVIYSGNKNKKSISITFSVYENTKVVEDILLVLKQNNAKATFFVGGCWADDNKETLIKILQDGHELGNNGYFKLDFKKLSEKGSLEEINSCHNVVKALCGYEMRLFCPPSGSYSSTTIKSAEKLGYKTVLWSKDTLDWRDGDIDNIYKRATNNLTSGDIILKYINGVNLKAVTLSENLP